MTRSARSEQVYLSEWESLMNCKNGVPIKSERILSLDEEEEELEASCSRVQSHDLSRRDWQEYEVVYSRIAIRAQPSTTGPIIGNAVKGDVLRLFNYDSSQKWRVMHFRLRGGLGDTVHAWVLLKHPQLGTLLHPLAKEASPAKPAEQEEADSLTSSQQIEESDKQGLMADPSPPCAQDCKYCTDCGQKLSLAAKFCSSCGAQQKGSPDRKGTPEKIVKQNEESDAVSLPVCRLENQDVLGHTEQRQEHQYAQEMKQLDHSLEN